MTDVEVIVEDGGLKEKPKKKKKEEIKEESKLVEGTTDEGMILREFDVPSTTPQTIQEQIYQPQVNNQQDEAPSPVTSPIQEQPQTNPKLDVQPTHIEPQIQQETTLRKYLPGMQYIEDIGVGGMCVVDRVKDSSGLELAFKSLNEKTMKVTSISDSEARVKALRLLREEARTINKLSEEGSKYTPQFALDATRSDNPGIYVKYIPSSLEERIEQGLEAKEAISLFLQMTEPIKMLHERHIALMDIKPSNYRLDKNGKPILVDLNLKRVKEAHRTSESLMLSCVTDSGKTIGTPLYMSPEQEEGKIQEGKEHLVDIYQLSSVLYQLLTGVRPAGHPDPLIEFGKIKSELGEERAIKLFDFIQRNRSRNIDKRSQSVDELVREVKGIVDYEEKEQDVKGIEQLANSQSAINPFDNSNKLIKTKDEYYVRCEMLREIYDIARGEGYDAGDVIYGSLNKKDQISDNALSILLPIKP